MKLVRKFDVTLPNMIRTPTELVRVTVSDGFCIADVRTATARLSLIRHFGFVPESELYVAPPKKIVDGPVLNDIGPDSESAEPIEREALLLRAKELKIRNASKMGLDKLRAAVEAAGV